MRITLEPKSHPEHGIILLDSHEQWGHDPFPDNMAFLSAMPEGWYDSLEQRNAPVVNPQGDGSYMPLRLFTSHRTVTLHCRRSQHRWSRQSSSLTDLRFLDLLNSLVTQRVRLTVEDGLGRRHSDGILTQPITQSWPGVESTRFTLILSLDPLKLGDPITSTLAGSGTLHIEDNGIASSLPSIHVDGPVTSLSLASSGHSVQWSGNAASLDIDFNDLTPSSGSITNDDLFAIQPGANSITISADQTAKTTLSFCPAWR
ncbi:hypothetical protein PT279_09010 [Bifidobacterium sp. ESL0784]|uniref:hypothetical protein n=1 Tax=Bifidobacterium sp. ESL0784 TaxID=2983231 RepID=UPI0023F67350|nr:hypothetical protein [Bifidobacterium sp. ESL0784]MDF7641721.1 hypothetical protein [Bifidobacterium sp. ESL0784]